MAKIHNFFSKSKDAVPMECAKCGMFNSCKNGRMKPAGLGEKKILVILDSPDAQADLKGTIAESSQYKFLHTELRKLGLNLYKDCWTVPAVRCYSERKPQKTQAMQCKPELEEDFKSLQPKHVFTFGNISLGTITDKYYSGIISENCMGDSIPIKEFGFYLHPFLDVPQIQATKKNKNYQSYVKRQLHKTIEFAKSGRGFINYTYDDPKNVEFLLDAKSVLDKLDKLMDEKEIALDYETTGIKPHRDGHKITVVGLSTDDRAYAFPLDYQEYWNSDDWNDINDALADLIEAKKPKMIVHNKVFENLWSRFILEVDSFMDECTMIRQHVLDHRRKTKSLKYQIFRRWGIWGYDASMDRYIKAPDSNSMNKMDEAPLDDQLLYVGLDAYMTMKLYREQEKEFAGKKNLQQANKFFQESSNSMTVLQESGLNIDEKYYQEIEKELTRTITGVEKSISANEEAQRFRKLYKKKFDHNSPMDLKKLLFGQMGLESVKDTAKGGQAVDAEVLKELDIPIGNYILDFRKYLKLRDTYLSQFKREVVDGHIYPFFYLTTVTSYRSSGSDPNFQNIPKRDKEAKNAIRSGIVPSKGNKLCEIDFSGMEVSTSATYHCDPNFINYLLDDSADMHRDNGCDIWMLEQDEMTPEIRFFVKNGWTFPQFYGDWYDSCGRALWKSSLYLNTAAGITLEEHLKGKGIYSQNEFLEHCKSAENIMWHERFKVYTEWKESINDFYLKNGYVETHMGFRFTGMMDRKQTANFPIQGTAFHLLLFCINLMIKEKQKRKWKSRFIGQVHDSCIIDLVPEEQDEIFEVFDYHVQHTIPETFKWANVPFRIDKEVSPIDGTFAQLEEL